ncbi:UNVERIFIED_CONTAM: hypothetical protein K2H54_041113 [Gekko kuhli]
MVDFNSFRHLRGERHDTNFVNKTDNSRTLQVGSFRAFTSAYFASPLFSEHLNHLLSPLCTLLHSVLFPSPNYNHYYSPLPGLSAGLFLSNPFFFLHAILVFLSCSTMDLSASSILMPHVSLHSYCTPHKVYPCGLLPPFPLFSCCTIMSALMTFFIFVFLPHPFC